MSGEKRIALFVCRYAFGTSGSIINSAIVLAREGYSVDIFLYHASNPDLVSFDDPRIQVYDLTESKTATRSAVAGAKRLVKKALKRVVPESVRAQARVLLPSLFVSGIPRVPISEPEFTFIPESILAKAVAAMANKQYLCFFGMEAQGLIFAGWLGSKLGVPVVYFNLELSFSGLAHYRPGLNLDLWRELEIKYHSWAVATIIQDEERARLLFENNRVFQHNVFFVPVALLGEPIRTRHRYFHQRFGLPGDERLLLHFGSINRYRKSPQVVQGVQKLPPGWTVVMHGALDESIREEMQRYDTGRRVILSTDLVPHKQLQILVSSADVGLVFYTDENFNEYTAGLASDKMARYMQCGLPVIVNDFPSFRRIIDKHRCGVCVTSPLEISSVLPQIAAEYDVYREAAYSCYIAQYEFSRHFEPVLEFLRKISETGTMI